MVPNPFQRVLRGLEEGGARATIVGGFAVVMHGVNRFTGDLNIVLDPAENKYRRTVEKLVECGFQGAPDFNAAAYFEGSLRAEWIKAGRRSLSLKDDESSSFGVEIFLEPPLPLEKLRLGAVQLNAYGRKFEIISLAALLEMKRLAGRPQDVMDIENLELVRSMYDEQGNSLAELLRLNPPPGVTAERIDDLVNFAKLSPEEKIHWLTEMLAALGSFCIFG